MNYFIEFAKRNFKVYNPRRGIIPFESNKHFEELTDIYDNNRFVLVKKYRQGGFTTFNILWALYNCVYKDNYKALMLFRSDHSALDSSKILDLALRHMPLKPEFSKCNTHEVEFVNKSRISFLEPISCCGRAFDCVIFDEAAFMQDLESHWMAIYPAVCNGGKAFMVSTPNGYNYFHTLYKGDKFYKYGPSYLERPDYTEEVISNLKRTLGEEYFRKEILAEF